ncbi:Cro/CI family transcriptional regulator [Shewanella sp. HL-SH5]|uniref:Cro/CI family transcriptional regulator n=1 Tax=Shewanella sp. HL-SH5 TaxID=3436241 RepID=UPI003EB8AA5E
MKTADVIAHFGGQGRLAKAIDVSQPAISKWGETVPELRAYQIQVLTNGKLKANFLLIKQAV